MRQLSQIELNTIYDSYIVEMDMVHPLVTTMVTILALSPILIILGAI